MGSPEASVVIPTTREVRVGFALEALAAQTLDPDRFEVVVVRDGAWSSEARPSEPGLSVRFVDTDSRSNIAVVRNRGWQAARGRLIAFTDDDCRPDPGWLASLLAATDGDGVVVQGRTEPDPDELHLFHGLARSQEIVGLSAWHETCNMLYPRALLERLGGFDERFAALGEDADLGLRARREGAEFRYTDDALVYHAVNQRTPASAIREALRRDTIPLLLSRHPQRREALWGGIFWQRSHALLLLAVGGVLLARRHRLAALAAIPYVRHHTKADSLRGGPHRVARHAAYLGIRALVDAAEVVTTTAAAVRERTLVI